MFCGVSMTTKRKLTANFLLLLSVNSYKIWKTQVTTVTTLTNAVLVFWKVIRRCTNEESA